ncbi:MAG: hypothetical protein R2942_11780 [Ignavibacteria bacterium]
MITVKNLTKKYPGGVTALDNVSFEVNKGEICGYVGTMVQANQLPLKYCLCTGL